MDSALNFANAHEKISNALIQTIRAASQFATEDIAFHRSLDPALGRLLNEQSSRLLKLTQEVIHNCDVPQPRDLNLQHVESIDSNWQSLVELADSLLERTDSCLDEFSGLIKRSTSRDGTASPVSNVRPIFRSHKNDDSRPLTLPKPQLWFEHQHTNQEAPPFRPIMETKPHGLISLQDSLVLERNEDGDLQYAHPYAAEITKYEYPLFVYTRAQPLLYPPFQHTSATWVDSIEDVHQMLGKLKKTDAIAIDLEHHDTHSYVGLVCLMQISTREQDWIIDTLRPWRRKLQILNEVFADPCILKVLHGAFMDVVWLQRDLGLYIVGLFDTFHASRTLGYPGGSLAYLLKRFVDFDAQKQYQTADWRLRPLPNDMFEYARSDTHFLLYVFDHLRNELIERSNFSRIDEDRLQVVLEKSKETALQRYEFTTYDAEKGLGRNGWFEQLLKIPIAFSREQLSVFRRVHQWRDMIARHEDESPHYIMAKHTIANIAQVIPHDMATLLGLVHPISRNLRRRLPELLDLIQDARTTGSEGPEMNELISEVRKWLGPQHRRYPGHIPPTLKQEAMPFKAQSLNETLEDSCRMETSMLWGSTLDIPFTEISISRPNLYAEDKAAAAFETPSFTRQSRGFDEQDQNDSPMTTATLPHSMAYELNRSDKVNERHKTKSMFEPASTRIVQQTAKTRLSKQARDTTPDHLLGVGHSIREPFNYIAASTILYAAVPDSSVESGMGKDKASSPCQTPPDTALVGKVNRPPRSNKSFTFTQ